MDANRTETVAIGTPSLTQHFAALAAS